MSRYAREGWVKFFVVSIFCSILMVRRQAFLILMNKFDRAGLFIIIDIIIWITQVLHNLISIVIMEYSPACLLPNEAELIGNFLSVVGIGFGIWGFIVVNDGRIDEIIAEAPDVSSIKKVMIWQVWCRLWVFVLLGLMILVALGILYVVYNSGGFDFLRQKEEHIKKIPKLHKFLESRLRASEQTAVQGCGICLQEYCEDDEMPLAELKCNKMHIFHLKCIEQWAEMNDSCPLCRDAILPEGFEE
mmetsp:Transcript_5913/g.9636  ORF Transcript_5913/g.9636 Transcript_5913/m.9636 type:complete len:245 (-) Transcript_5913:20-754(-)|eukprot:CAMPEP_0170481256 /NCGR_PEP_ID=MMETSP0208-20121228/1770_1 /TAXON_ID=197538 /ORGANISM="Strombidium inclinatum, Strain S3" /LENGTH=244 /DNA_ID=CAMNT_0010753923 /DNA_START=555 /DNA_END=1289 /DNA_ORIENTATION=+